MREMRVPFMCKVKGEGEKSSNTSLSLQMGGMAIIPICNLACTASVQELTEMVECQLPVADGWRELLSAELRGAWPELL